MSDFEEIRERYLPTTGVTTLFVGESAPDPRGTRPRFFYLDELTQHDNLFRGLMLALYGATADALRSRPKRSWLEAFQADGYYLIDVCAAPVNASSPTGRRGARLRAVASFVDKVNSIRPEGVIVCHGPTFEDVCGPLLDAGHALLHDEPIPFPLGNHRTRFARNVRSALRRGSQRI